MYNFKKGDTVFYIDDRYANNVDNIQEGIVFKVEDTHNNCWSDAGTKVYLSEPSYDYVYLNRCFINKEEVIKHMCKEELRSLRGTVEGRQRLVETAKKELVNAEQKYDERKAHFKQKFNYVED